MWRTWAVNKLRGENSTACKNSNAWSSQIIPKCVVVIYLYKPALESNVSSCVDNISANVKNVNTNHISGEVCKVPTLCDNEVTSSESEWTMTITRVNLSNKREDGWITMFTISIKYSWTSRRPSWKSTATLRQWIQLPSGWTMLCNCIVIVQSDLGVKTGSKVTLATWASQCRNFKHITHTVFCLLFVISQKHSFV